MSTPLSRAARRVAPRPLLLLLLLLLVAASGCVRSKQARDVKFSGFLEDYSMLEPGDERLDTLYEYVTPGVDFASYDAMLLEPVQLWRSEERQREGVSEEDAQVVINNFYKLLYEAFSQDYEMVETPRPHAMRLEVALTSIEDEFMVFDLASTVSPIGIATSTMLDILTGKPAFVGEASVEYRYTDAMSGENLIIGVDRRVGGKRIDKGFESWDDVTSACRYWAALARYGLCDLRGGDDCVEPVP